MDERKSQEKRSGADWGFIVSPGSTYLSSLGLAAEYTPETFLFISITFE